MRVRSAVGSATMRSSAHRNAASVLPDPVGALISVCSPVAIAGQASDCAGVGVANARSNHSRTCGVNADSGTRQRVGALRGLTVVLATPRSRPAFAIWLVGNNTAKVGAI